MAAFELNDFSNSQNQSMGASRPCPQPQPPTLKEENIITFKIYDSCRSQDCLDYSVIGPARAACPVTIDGRLINEGEVIVPPIQAASVSLECPEIVRIIIVGKSENCFRKGYWDIDLRYVICYKLIFRNANGDVILCVEATSIYNSKVSLFGSEGCDLFLVTDLINSNGSFEGDPFVLAEGKVIGLTASLIYDCNPPGNGLMTGTPVAVEVTLGLFTIVKLFRIVDLAVQSTGFTIPDECAEVMPLDPCSYFDNLDFPMDIFAPPQKPEFFAGISSNIPSGRQNHNHNGDCGCGCDDK